MSAAAATPSAPAEPRARIDEYTRSSNLIGLLQALTTVVPLAALWWAAILGAGSPPYLVTLLATLVMSLFLVRGFVLMHECGHGSLFRSAALNRGAGFALGVLCGMPQYVWSRHHNYHHATNGNWARYRGPLAILSVDEFGALSGRQQRAYVRARYIWMAPLAGFVYLILNPRLTWLKGTASLLVHLLREKRAQPRVSLRAHAATFRSAYWASPSEYRHMTYNNLVLLSMWVAMSWLIGPLLFFSVYLSATSLAGGVGIVLFTVQHNFEHSYASADAQWDRHDAALHGTSYLDLPAWLNWFTANIGYHHVHHLSARIPNYRLAACHRGHPELFEPVRRLRWRDVRPSLKFVLWDAQARRIVSVAEYRNAQSAAAGMA
ncbi:fatty acid desaturase [Panacagrimonas sp.]|uniref:fatty acid desaturase n=1 Tax=Panacagrimonas sp. TaxID=2480088 RepID=UPI003B52D062